MKKKFTILATVCLVAIWAGLSLLAWCLPAKESSDSERRLLAQLPQVSVKTVFDGSFAKDFEEYTLDQFPGRETFRSIKALFHRYVLGNWDNNGIYIAQGSAAELEKKLDKDSITHALKQFDMVYELYLKENGCHIYSAVVPDKGYYLAEENGYPAMDYEELFSMVEQGMPWAQSIDLTDHLSIDDYYRTDLHWRQESLQPAAEHVAKAMDAYGPMQFDMTALERPFYGVYCGQAALPMEPDTMYLMGNEIIAGSRVYNYTEGSYSAVYDLQKLESKDLYDVYLSGPQSLLRIENPNAESQRHLIIFRDSFGSTLAPMLLHSYSTVTLIDLRYIQPQLLGKYVDFSGADVLFLHSTLVLNRNLI